MKFYIKYFCKDIWNVKQYWEWELILVKEAINKILVCKNPCSGLPLKSINVEIIAEVREAIFLTVVLIICELTIEINMQ